MRNPIAVGRVLALHQLTARLAAISIAAFLSAVPFHAAWAQTAPNLKSAGSFAVLGGGAVTCTNSTVTVIGDVGARGAFTNTGCTITGGMPPATNTAAVQAYADFLSAYAMLANAQCGTTIPVAAFTGNVPALGPLAPGVYCFPAGVTFTDTTLTLNGPANGIWIFKVGAALTGSGFRVVMTGGGQPCNVFWSVGAAATLSTSTLPPLFQGNILVGADITVTGGTVNGDVLAGGTGSTSVPTGAVTLTSTIVAGCGGALSVSSSCKGKKHHGHHHKGNGNGHDDDDDDDDDDHKQGKKDKK